jgi:hypothetical protein
MSNLICCRKLEKDDHTKEEGMRNMNINETTSEREIRGYPILFLPLACWSQYLTYVFSIYFRKCCLSYVT